MNTETLYRLADATVAEALVDSWVAWPHTFSPVAYSLHLLNYQKKTLASYLQNPALHHKSSANPKLLGGAFVNLPIDRVPAIQVLLENLESGHSDDLRLAQELIDFQNLLDKEALGQSLNNYYPTLPESLRGYTELLYDYHSRPIVRCIESLFYRSRHYKKHLQTLYLFRQTHDRMRAYYMSTPRLPDADSIGWTLPFAQAELDALFQLDSQPQPLAFIRELLGLSAADDAKLLPLLTDQPPRPTANWQGPGTRIRYFGHASVLVEFNGIAILLDPFLSVQPSEGGISRYTFQDLPPKIDYVLITHGHHDHFVFETLLRIRHKVGCLVVPKASGIFYGDISLKLMAKELGFTQILEVEPLDTIALPQGEIVAIPFLGEHNDLPFAKSAYLVQAGDKQILFAADSNCLDKRMYENIRAQRGAIDVVFLGMEWVGAPLSWVYGPILPKLPDYKHCQSRRSNGSNADVAMALLQAVDSRQVYIYAIGREPWLQYFMALEPEADDVYIQEINKLLTACQSRGFTKAQRLYGKAELFLEG
ncbi:MBL fold metallo-hydrolase [Methylovulum psychrotolerans]|uniref:MBL fold metallo-hydrolase n=1 Tax=Methylovulum psychrotolerans TaxID=1704499 RepID=A0A2S5CKE2_9GAMM|nr:MBL fold metallo-hydrolase [Methylovulum psychrotolerans]POZ51254.1 MBL fold metallo-hydrolase [Methylovulum psychrotolerans]